MRNEMNKLSSTNITIGRRSVLAAVAALIAILFSMSSSGPAVIANAQKARAALPPHPQDGLSGRYEGTAKTKGMGDLVVALDLQVDSGAVTGNLQASTASFSVSGTYKDGQLELRFKFGDQDGQIKASLQKDAISGNWILGDDGGAINLKKNAAAATELSTEQPALPLQNVAFIGVNLIPMDKEQVVRNQTVVIKNGRIVEIGPAAETKPPADAIRIDGRGKFLMPGLIDMHVHVFTDPREMRLFVANGITTVRNMAGQPAHLKLRDQIASGQVFGPTLYTCGPLLLGYKDPKTVIQQVTDQCAAGYDCIKIYNIFDWSPEA